HRDSSQHPRRPRHDGRRGHLVLRRPRRRTHLFLSSDPVLHRHRRDHPWLSRHGVNAFGAEGPPWTFHFTVTAARRSLHPKPWPANASCVRAGYTWTFRLWMRSDVGSLAPVANRRRRTT